MLRSILTEDGKTTVPEEVREFLALEPGDEITWEIREGWVEVRNDRQVSGGGAD